MNQAVNSDISEDSNSLPEGNDVAPDRPAEQTVSSRAWEAYREKRYEECQEICKPHLTAAPQSAEFWAIEGLVRQRQGQHRGAIEAFRAALAFGPGFPWVHHALATSAMDLGDMALAVVHLRVAAKERNDVADYQIKLAIALQATGHHGEASAPLQRAHELAQDNPLVHYRMGINAQQLQQHEQALKHFSDALRLSPHYEAAYFNQGAVFCELGRFEEGLASFQRVIDLAPNNADAWLRRASALFSRGIIADAIKHALRAVHLSPGLTEAHVLLGKLYASQGRMDSADECFRNALKMSPFNVHTRLAQAVMLERRGDVAEAKEVVDTALDEVSNSPQLLALLGRMAKSEDDRRNAVERIEQRLNSDPPIPKDVKAHLQFVLGNLYDRLREPERAFANLKKANKYRHETRPFDRKRAENDFKAIREIFSAELMRNAPRSQVDGQQMIFIVGMPRSGTSLTEQIIDAHPKAFGSGELTMLDRIARRWPDGDDARPAILYPHYMPNIDASGLTEIAYRYLNRLPEGARQCMRVTDKMPYNFMHVGLISLLFPGARIIHCMRNPVDTTLSCFLQDFLEGNSFSYDLEDCGFFYGQYRTLMAHWHDVLPSYPILDLRYEDMVSDPENTVRNLLKFCDLEWDDACLNFHKSRRQVHTASYQQVREPLYTRAVNRWKAYEEYLGPLLGELAPYMDSDDTEGGK